MRKVFFVLITCAFLFETANAITISGPVKANDVVIPIDKTGKTITLQELSSISTKQFEIIAHKKLNFADRLMFKAAQRKIRNSINRDGTINNRKIERFYKRYNSGKDIGFNLGGFALGFLLGLLGVLIAYIINNDKNHSRRVWAWIGFAVFAVLFILISVASLPAWT